MSDVTWTNAQGGSWLDGGNWDSGQVPDASDWVFLPQLYGWDGSVLPYSVTISGGEAVSVFPLAIYGSALGPAGADGVAPSSITVAITGGSSLTAPISTDFTEIGLGPQPPNYGEFDLSGGSALTLEFDSGPGITVRFADDTANIFTIAEAAPGQSFLPYDPDAFGGSIAGFGPNDLIQTHVAFRAADTLHLANGVLTLTTLAAEFGPRDVGYVLTPGAVLRFDGPYRAGNFTLVDDGGYDAIAFVPLTITGALSGRSTINGTPGDDILIGYGGLNTITSNGGSDRIQSGSGGYSTINAGTAGDGQGAFTETITLGGRANRVTGGDANFFITGDGGDNIVTLGAGNDGITLAGAYNTITVGMGANTISAGGGFSHVLITAPAFVQTTPTYADTVVFTGDHNELDVDTERGGGLGYFGAGSLIVQGGTGYGVFNLQESQTDLVTGGVCNIINIDNDGGTTDTITPGSGADTVSLAATPTTGLGDFVIHLAGAANLVQGVAGSVEIDGGTGRDRYIFDNPDSMFAAAAITIQAPGLFNNFALSSANANTITAGSGYDTVSITDPPPDPTTGYPPFYEASSITLDGPGNSLTAGSPDVTATGGLGGGTFVLGNGTDTITTGGTLNHVTLGSGNDSVSPGSGSDVVTLNGSNAAVQLLGSNNMVFLNAGASGSIAGAAPGLRVIVTGQIGQEVINGLGADPGAFIHLMGGAGGYTSLAQISAALIPDGNGGTMLPLGTGSIDLAGLSPAISHAGLFGIG